MRISDWSSDVCSSDLRLLGAGLTEGEAPEQNVVLQRGRRVVGVGAVEGHRVRRLALQAFAQAVTRRHQALRHGVIHQAEAVARSEEHTSELQSLMRISYAVFCLKKKKKHQHPHETIRCPTYLHK